MTDAQKETLIETLDPRWARLMNQFQSARETYIGALHSDDSPLTDPNIVREIEDGFRRNYTHLLDEIIRIAHR